MFQFSGVYGRTGYTYSHMVLVIIPKSGGIVSWGEPFRRLCFCEPCQVYFHSFSLLGSNTQLIFPPPLFMYRQVSNEKTLALVVLGIETKKS